MRFSEIDGGTRGFSGRIAKAATLVALATLAAFAAVLLSACGGASETADAGEVLFAGRPGELSPHDVGSTARFRIEARSGSESTSATRTTVVLSEGPDGEFLLETSTDTGIRQRLRARETPDEVRVEAIAVDDGSGFAWRDLDPAAVLVRVPVVAGATLEAEFARTIDLRIESGGASTVRSLVVTGESRRRAVGWEDLVLGGETLRAIRWEIEGESRTETIVLGGESLEIRAQLRGVEHRAPGLGLVREEADLEISVGGATTAVHLVAERET
ncbi:MAG: hypothetical protein FJ144_02560 [Deltaproteobacteria bacterium]|nr:hypothetical protein [Deltaproteobacteria bacterium]